MTAYVPARPSVADRGLTAGRTAPFPAPRPGLPGTTTRSLAAFDEGVRYVTTLIIRGHQTRHMAQFEDGRALLRGLQDRFDDWVSGARVEAYEELFEGSDAVLTGAELRQLDRIDSRLSRERGEGVWGTDEYGVVAARVIDEESAPPVVCTYYPRVPEYGLRGASPIDDELHDDLDEALWNYAERVVELVQEDVDEFVRSAEVDTWS